MRFIEVYRIMLNNVVLLTSYAYSDNAYEESQQAQEESNEVGSVPSTNAVVQEHAVGVEFLNAPSARVTVFTGAILVNVTRRTQHIRVKSSYQTEEVIHFVVCCSLFAFGGLERPSFEVAGGAL